MKKVVVGLVSAAALAVISIGMAASANSTVASDQDIASNDNSAGFYVGGNLGYGKFDINNAGATDAQKRGFAWNADLGYQFNPYLAVEGGYTHFNQVKTAGTLPANKIYGIDLAAKGIYPINDQFNVFAKAGAMNLSYTTIAGTETSKIVPELGIGASYNLTSNIALTVQGVTTLAIKSGHSTMPQTYAAYAGASYKFNV